MKEKTMKNVKNLPLWFLSYILNHILKIQNEDENPLKWIKERQKQRASCLGCLINYALLLPLCILSAFVLAIGNFFSPCVSGGKTLSECLSQVSMFPSTANPEPTPTDIPELGLSGDNPVLRNEDWQKQERDDEGITIQMVLVPIGCFDYSQHSSSNDGCISEPFWIGRYEITNAEFGSHGRFEGNNRPRDSITWFQANSFCERQGGSLPTDKEWEYAARGPNNLSYPWEGGVLREDYLTFWLNEGNVGSSEIVGSHPAESASWVGAYDMVGNVWEWTSPRIGSVAVVRGGSWSNDPERDANVFDLSRSNNRSRLNMVPPDSLLSQIGFRCRWDFHPEHGRVPID